MIVDAKHLEVLQSKCKTFNPKGEKHKVNPFKETCLNGKSLSPTEVAFQFSRKKEICL